ncbi:MAG TPA: hypothetical protein V6C91_15955 [Coleofasciculaceae cyanobacterium]
MRLWQFWWRTLILSTQYNPPEFVELLMTSLTMALLVSWGFTHAWPYLALSSSLAIGAAVSMWVREIIRPSPHSYVLKLLGFLLLLYGFYGFTNLAPYFGTISHHG